MTKEELEKEAGEWLKSNIKTENREGITFNIVPTPVQIYCAGAEPREKRIAELEKENAELKHQLNKNPCVCNTEWHCNDCLERLAKAKKIIKLLLHSLKNEGSDYTFALENTHPALAKAEQFLKDSEVEK